MSTIRGTRTTPRLTLKDVEDMARAHGLDHARFIVDQCATQVGQVDCEPAYTLLDRLEWEDETVQS